jgi:hypothetical protein
MRTVAFFDTGDMSGFWRSFFLEKRAAVWL